MAEDEHSCEGCKNSHLAAAWFRNETRYLCGEEYNKLSPDQKLEWTQTHPGSDE